LELAGSFLLAPYIPSDGNIGISGKVTDADGKPVAGAFVMVYTERGMVGQPAYLSKPTNKDGEYSVFVKGPGTYFVAARQRYGGLPKKGEPYGTYDGSSDHSVAVAEKSVSGGIDVKLGPFPFDLAKPVPPAGK